MKQIPTYNAKQRFRETHLDSYRDHLLSLLKYQNREGLDDTETKENLVVVLDLIDWANGE